MLVLRGLSLDWTTAGTKHGCVCGLKGTATCLSPQVRSRATRDREVNSEACFFPKVLGAAPMAFKARAGSWNRPPAALEVPNAFAAIDGTHPRADLARASQSLRRISSQAKRLGEHGPRVLISGGVGRARRHTRYLRRFWVGGQAATIRHLLFCLWRSFQPVRTTRGISEANDSNTGPSQRRLTRWGRSELALSVSSLSAVQSRRVWPLSRRSGTELNLSLIRPPQAQDGGVFITLHWQQSDGRLSYAPIWRKSSSGKT
jgi:hypothetical protein